MNATDIKKHLESALDEYQRRTYLGMSGISRCPLFLYNTLRNGDCSPSATARRYCHEGYLHEEDIIRRLLKAGLLVANLNREIVAPFDPRFRGHIDGEIVLPMQDPILLEVKSVNEDRFYAVSHDCQVPSEHMAQVQCYLRFGRYARAFLVYKARQTGMTWVVDIECDDALGAALERKAKMVLAALDAGAPPDCECGHCR